jgi:hypothetical protein
VVLGLAFTPFAGAVLAIAMGAARTILSSDLGMIHGPTPTDGFRQFIQTFQSLGAGPRELDLMTKENPARILDL